MEKLSFLVVIVLAMVMTMAPKGHGVIDQSPKAVKKWFKELPLAEEKLIELHFYFHDILSGKNPSATQVARSNITSKSPTLFGVSFVMDDPLTVGPEPDSKTIGFARGMYASTSREDVDLFMTLNYVFTDGKYNGSSLSVLGHNPVFHEYREFPIVGGSGVFRLARGIATARTHTFDAATGDAVVEYHATVLHYV